MLLVYCNDGKRTYASTHPSKHYVFPHTRKDWAFHFILSGHCVRVNRENNVTKEEPLTGPGGFGVGPGLRAWLEREAGGFMQCADLPLRRRGL